MQCDHFFLDFRLNLGRWISRGQFLEGEFFRGPLLLEKTGPKNSTREFGSKIRVSKISFPKFGPNSGFGGVNPLCRNLSLKHYVMNRQLILPEFSMGWGTICPNSLRKSLNNDISLHLYLLQKKVLLCLKSFLYVTLPTLSCQEQLSLHLLRQMNSKTICICICICYEMQP